MKLQVAYNFEQFLCIKRLIIVVRESWLNSCFLFVMNHSKLWLLV